ncbi:hypothetical protein CERZMDRAFT_99601 [Cercospora zeae-maydis SCOH1-5]|uniref:Uncharacterized protein n=1 Tax=Cercospora zeae-maydis SCOH1-5 TaxID=717836 RepID=A0A6A6F9V3_9PEZI|nr:hypothetical protein CERZMDRAFT_99601 [Cercospora zeae-maydis SCOH1-5]
MACIRRTLALLMVVLSTMAADTKASKVTGEQPSDIHPNNRHVATEVVSVASALTILLGHGTSITLEPAASTETGGVLEGANIPLNHETTVSLGPGVTVGSSRESTTSAKQTTNPACSKCTGPVCNGCDGINGSPKPTVNGPSSWGPTSAPPQQGGVVVVTMLQTVTRVAHPKDEAPATARPAKRASDCYDTIINGSPSLCGVPTTTYTVTYPPYVITYHGKASTTIFRTFTSDRVVYVASQQVNVDTEVHYPGTTVTNTRYSYKKRDLPSPSTSGASTTTTTAYISTVVITMPEPSSSIATVPVSVINATVSVSASHMASASNMTLSTKTDVHEETSTFAPSLSSELGASYFTKISPIATFISEICKVNGTCYPAYNTSALAANPNFTVPLTAFSANLTTPFTFVSPPATTTSKSTSKSTSVIMSSAASASLQPSTTRNSGGEQEGGAAGNSACAFLTGLMVLVAMF